jgi:adenosylhomocysteine nucleosidase
MLILSLKNRMLFHFHRYIQIPGMPAVYKGDQALLDCALQLSCQDPSVHLTEGQIGSGDAFISEQEQITGIQKLFPQMKAAEMEAAGIAQSCYLFHTPFLIIRSISDVVGDRDNHISFDEFLPLAARNSMDIVIKILKTFKKDKQEEPNGKNTQLHNRS